MDNLPTKDALLAAADKSWGQLAGLIEPLSDDDLTRRSTGHNWLLKDELTHLAAWNREAVLIINDLLQGRPIQDYADFDIWNERFYQAHKDTPPAQARAELIAAHHALVALLRSLPSGAYTAQVVEWAGIPGHYADHFAAFPLPA